MFLDVDKIIFHSNEYVFTQPKLFFIHRNEKNLHSPALQIPHDACIKTNVENQEKLDYF